MARREVEGAGALGTPVENEGGALGVVLTDSDAADVVVAPVGEIEAAETETVFGRVQDGKETGLLRDEDVPFQTRLESARALTQGALNSVFGIIAQIFEALVQPRDELLLVLEFDV
ncbi:hypothetical protein [Streptomyces sp. NPDC048606]|uniref:hypothetical protein n=1 Tax=Streptomyces sp. NPDC048606 TaxID=3154726 RepID=UPI003412419C